jgi:hypothetical protein
MNWCGTIEADNRMKMLTLALHCCTMNTVLMDLADAEYNDAKTKKKCRKSRTPQTEENGQMRLFPLTTEQREEFSKFAKNLRHFLHEGEERKHDDAYWKEYAELEYTKYEFYKLFGQFTDDELKAAIEPLEKLGAGEALDDYEPLIKFIGEVQSYANWFYGSGECF